MNDSGSGGDSVASDGIWSAQILDQGADNRIVQFYVKASSKNGQEVTLPSRGQNVPAMYVVDNDQIELTLLVIVGSFLNMIDVHSVLAIPLHGIGSSLIYQTVTKK